MNVHLKALGCRLNEAELERWARSFQARGYEITNDSDKADLVVINTCAVTQVAVRKSRQIIRRTRRLNPQAKLVISGCYASLPTSHHMDIGGIDLVVPNHAKDDLVEIVSRELKLGTEPVLNVQPSMEALFARGRNRAFIKIQDGCRYRCTFCIVTVARGAERSRSIAEIVLEINKLADHGLKEAVLTGIHVGGYGSDTGSSLHELINAILNHTDLPRLRLASIEPWDLSKNFFELFRSVRLMPHLHLPLQSGSDSVLRRMARRCKTDAFEKLVNQARELVANFNVTTDIIVGFPGETDREWREGLEFIEKVGFAHIHIFRYSPRLGTKAANLPNQISSQVIKQRSGELHHLASRMKRAALERHLGHIVPVLWEQAIDHNEGEWTEYQGYTPNFLKVSCRVPLGENIDNEIRSSKLTAITNGGESLLAEAICEPVNASSR